MQHPSEDPDNVLVFALEESFGWYRPFCVLQFLLKEEIYLDTEAE